MVTGGKDDNEAHNLFAKSEAHNLACGSDWRRERRKTVMELLPKEAMWQNLRTVGRSLFSSSLLLPSLELSDTTLYEP